MSTPSSPLEAFQAAARTVLGRIISFCVACSLGGVAGCIIDNWNYLGADWFGHELLSAMAVVPTAFNSIFTSYGLVVFPLCLLFAFVFIRLNLSFGWLFVPFVLVTWQTAALRMSLLGW
ncbi:MAG: hypothetical protein U1F71_11290 [Verrucomicrobiaceae bacterium]